MKRIALWSMLASLAGSLAWGEATPPAGAPNPAAATSAATDMPAPGECNIKLLGQLHVDVAVTRWQKLGLGVVEKETMDDQTRDLLQFGNGRLCDKAVWDAIPGGQAAYDKMPGLDKIRAVRHAALVVRDSKNPPAGAPNPLAAAAAATDKPAPGECNKALLRQLHVNPAAGIGFGSWGVVNRDHPDEQTKTLLQFGNPQLCDKAVWDAIPGGQAAYDKQDGLEKIRLILNAAAGIRRSKNPTPAAPAVTGASAFNDVENAVVDFMQSDEDTKMSDADKAALQKELDAKDFDKVRARIKGTLKAYVLGQSSELDRFLDDNYSDMKKKDFTDYFCANGQLPSAAAAGALTETKAKPQAGQLATGHDWDARANPPGLAVQAQPPRMYSTDTTEQAQLALACATNDANPGGTPPGPNLDNNSNVPSPGPPTLVNTNNPPGPSGPGGGSHNLTAGSDSQKHPGGLNLDADGKRDSTAIGIMTGGLFGLLAMGAAAGPAGILMAALVGGLIGFFGWGLTHPKKDK